MSPASPTASLPPDRLTDAELADLAGIVHYKTAPEYASPVFQHFDEVAQHSQGRWRTFFRRSVVVLFFILLLSTITGMAALFNTWGWLTKTGLFRVEVVGIIVTTAGAIYEFYYQLKLRKGLAPWAVARGHAETVRSAVWLYLFDLLPPGNAHHPDPETAWRRVLSAVTTRFAQAPDPAAEPTAHLQQLRQRLRHLSLAGRVQAYCTARLDSQCRYFHRRAGELCATADRWQRIIYWLLGLAISWNVFRLVAVVCQWQQVAPLFSFNLFIILVYALGLAKAYIESEDMSILATRYRQMHDNLLAQAEHCPRTPLTLAALRHFVLDSERILRNETAEWTTRRLEPDPDEPT